MLDRSKIVNYYKNDKWYADKNVENMEWRGRPWAGISTVGSGGGFKNVGSGG